MSGDSTTPPPGIGGYTIRLDGLGYHTEAQRLGQLKGFREERAEVNLDTKGTTSAEAAAGRHSRDSTRIAPLQALVSRIRASSSRPHHIDSTRR